MLPYVVGYVPLAVFLGTVVGRSADPLAGWSGTLLVYGGGAHLTLLELLDRGASLSGALLAAALLNARVLLYSTDLVELWGDAPLWRRLLAAATVIDVTWSVAVQRSAARRSHYTGAALVLTVGWLVLVSLGVLLATSLDPRAGVVLESAAPLCLAAIVAPYLTGRPQAAAVGAAAVVAGLAHAGGAAAGPVVLAAMLAASVVGAAARRA
jgi:predicted branched-subunit amino acid permease